MKKSTSIILLAVVIILFIAPLVMYNGYGEDEGYFGGADDQAGDAIEETGYEPWFSSIWEPPSSYRGIDNRICLWLLERPI